MKFKNNIKENEVTDKKLYKSRRQFLKSAAIIGTSSILGSSQLAAFEIKKYPTVNKYNIKNEAITKQKYATHYNNFYEFSTSKEGPALLAETLKPEPWKIEVTGHAKNTGFYDIDDILKKQNLEERIYRFRCVEAWSMVIPWLGFKLSDLIKQFEPTSKAKYVYFETLKDPKQMPGQNRQTIPWPYREGLRMDEATNELAFMAVGMYGEKLPKQNGAPLRLVVPWKYGFKNIKSIVKIAFVEKQPLNSWQQIAASEYGFYANVNPKVDHPRWSQASERRIGAGFSLFNPRIDTLMYNGYADYVADMYKNLDLRKYF
ncbi:MAG TPA: protein-methionine-sulfoxide reductase catalytic subunit MsrP [Oceanospirillales bacterium]|nr:protein-methionine-sulfoxide reductase catalytic subunit MsrP [Oceanospirillales bacterium]